MVLKIIAGVRTKRLRLIRHVRIFDAHVTGGAAVDPFQIRQDQLPNLDGVRLRFRPLEAVGGVFTQERLVCPLVGVIFLQKKDVDRRRDEQPDPHETGYQQPTLKELIEVRGTNSYYHNNAIQSWKIHEDGNVRNVQM